MKQLITLARYSKFGIGQLCYNNIIKHSSSSFVINSLTSPFVKLFSDFRNDDTTGKQDKSDEIVGSVTDSGKYKTFRDENASLILDVIEERQRIADFEEIEEHFDEFAGLNLERGVTGVFDIEELINVLHRENAVDIFVASLPRHLQYVDYIVVVSGKSVKHMLGLAEFVRRLYKIKRNKEDRIPRIEGETSKDWLAIDLGNIALHIMSRSARPIYDIENLWAVGKEFDEKSNSSEDSLSEILKKHAISFDDFNPNDSLR